MNIVSFPTSIPSQQQLELTGAQLCTLLSQLSVNMVHQAGDLAAARDALEFAAPARRTADKIGKANAGWAAMVATIRDSWRI
jgi:hypothetical protein